jgi:hypothetical protein
VICKPALKKEAEFFSKYDVSWNRLVDTGNFWQLNILHIFVHNLEMQGFSETF